MRPFSAAFQLDPRYDIVMDVINRFERSENLRVDDTARSYLIRDILVPPREFRAGLREERLPIGLIQNRIYDSLLEAGRQARERSLPVDSVNHEVVESACHKVIDQQFGCEWPFIIC